MATLPGGVNYLARRLLPLGVTAPAVGVSRLKDRRALRRLLAAGRLARNVGKATPPAWVHSKLGLRPAQTNLGVFRETDGVGGGGGIYSAEHLIVRQVFLPLSAADTW